MRLTAPGKKTPRTAFDPASVDKPSLGLWIKALPALAFGFNGSALMLPQAVAGVLSVLVLYFLVRDLRDERAGPATAFALPGLGFNSKPIQVFPEPPEEQPLLVATGGNERLSRWVIEHGDKVDRTLWDNNGIVTFPVPDRPTLFDVEVRIR